MRRRKGDYKVGENKRKNKSLARSLVAHLPPPREVSKRPHLRPSALSSFRIIFSAHAQKRATAGGRENAAVVAFFLFLLKKKKKGRDVGFANTEDRSGGREARREREEEAEPESLLALRRRLAPYLRALFFELPSATDAFPEGFASSFFPLVVVVVFFLFFFVLTKKP